MANCYQNKKEKAVSLEACYNDIFAVCSLTSRRRLLSLTVEPIGKLSFLGSWLEDTVLLMRFLEPFSWFAVKDKRETWEMFVTVNPKSNTPCCLKSGNRAESTQGKLWITIGSVFQSSQPTLRSDHMEDALRASEKDLYWLRSGARF